MPCPIRHSSMLTHGCCLRQAPERAQHEPSGSGKSEGEGEALPPASRGQVFRACAQTSLLLGGLALLLRSRAAQLGPAALHTDPAAVQRLLACARTCRHHAPVTRLEALHVLCGTA